MLGIIFYKNESSSINKMFKLNSINIITIDNKTKGVYLCLNNIKNNQQEIKFINKVIKKLKKNNISEVLIQNDIYTISKNLVGKIQSEDIYIVTGNNIYEKNLDKIVQYLLDVNKKIVMEQVNIGIVIDKITYKRIEYIKQLSTKVKCMSIITKDKLKFENTCKNIFEDEGLAVKLSDNLKTGLKGCNMIINFDVCNSEVIEFLPFNCIFINFSDCIEKINKNFKGIIINDIKLKLNNNNKIFEYIQTDKFRNTALIQILNEEENEIENLIGIKGIIPINDVKKFDIIKRNKLNKVKKNKR